MDIDMSILRMLEREKEISFDVLVEAIEQALLTAYHKTPGAQEHARVELDRKTGHVTVLAARARRGGQRRSRSTTTPPRASAGSPRRPRSRSCCSGCATPRTTSGSVSSPARRATSSPGVIQQGRNPDDVMVDLGKLEALLPLGRAGAGGAATSTAPGSSAWWSRVRKGMRGPQVMLSRSHPNLVKKLFALEVPEIADGTVEIAGDRPRGRPPHQDRGAARPSRASTPRAPASARWASGCAT